MHFIKSGILFAIPVAFALTLGAVPQQGQAASVCKKVGGVPGKGCVGKRDMRRGAVNGSRLSKGLREHVSERESFSIVLDGDGATKTVATHGPLTIRARCILDFFDPDFFDPDANADGLTVDRVEIVASSSAAPWFEEDESDGTGGSVTVPANALAAGQEVVVFSESVRSSSARFDSGFDETSMIGPGGHFMEIDGSALGSGLNILGHDCILVGTVMKITVGSAGQ